jgi:hypothetical protein
MCGSFYSEQMSLILLFSTFSMPFKILNSLKIKRRIVLGVLVNPILLKRVVD